MKVIKIMSEYKLIEKQSCLWTLGLYLLNTIERVNVIMFGIWSSSVLN